MYKSQVELDRVSEITANTACSPELQIVFRRFVPKREPLFSTPFSAGADTERNATASEMPHLDRRPLRGRRAGPGRDSRQGHRARELERVARNDSDLVVDR